MDKSAEGSRSWDPAVRILRACGRVSARAVEILFATLSAMSDKANAPLLPPDTKPLPRPEDYRP
jgi:hypothetical protein